MKFVNTPVRKKDAMALVTGKPVYTDDLAPSDCLIVKVLQESLCPCADHRYQYRGSKEDSRDRMHFYLAGCSR